MIDNFIKKTIEENGDSDRHLMTIFSIALACKGSCYFELGVRNGATTQPIVEAAKINNAEVYSVDTQKDSNLKINYKKWNYCIEDSLFFLEKWKKENNRSPDFIYIDDWHSYDHVKKELEIIDQIVSPSTIILLHDLMYGNTCPFYHSDLTLKDGQWANGGPYRAVAELNNQFWEFSTLPWNNGLTILRKKYSSKFRQK
jgi:hypothetical protein